MTYTGSDTQTPEQHLHGLSDEELACKARRRHNPPVLKPGPLPAGVQVFPQRDGGHQMTARCLDCGMVIEETTLPGGLDRDPGTYLRYRPARKGYYAPARAGLMPRDYKSEQRARVAPYLNAWVAQSTQREAG